MTILPLNGFSDSTNPDDQIRGQNEAVQQLSNFVSEQEKEFNQICCQQYDSKSCQKINQCLDSVDKKVQDICLRTLHIQRKYKLYDETRFPLLNNPVKELVDKITELRQRIASLREDRLGKRAGNSVKRFGLRIWSYVPERVKDFGAEVVDYSLRSSKKIGSRIGSYVPDRVKDFGAKVADRILFQSTGSWNDFIPPLATIGTGVILSSTFREGILFGSLILPVNVVVAGLLGIAIMRAYKIPIKKIAESEYTKIVSSMNLFRLSIVTPIIEELAFRGMLQPLVAAITRSPQLGIAISSMLFGATHYLNPHPMSGMQAISTGFLGLGCGIEMDRQGILASIGVHIVNNFLVFSLAQPPVQNLLKKLLPEKSSKPRIS